MGDVEAELAEALLLDMDGDFLPAAGMSRAEEWERWAGEVRALVGELEDPRVQRPGMQRRRIWSSRLRALFHEDLRPREGA